MTNCNTFEAKILWLFVDKITPYINVDIGNSLSSSSTRNGLYSYHIVAITTLINNQHPMPHLFNLFPLGREFLFLAARPSEGGRLPMFSPFPHSPIVIPA
jgi:hypothetical protein